MTFREQVVASRCLLKDSIIYCAFGKPSALHVETTLGCWRRVELLVGPSFCLVWGFGRVPVWDAC